jgi:uncharacterized membrane protein
VTDPSSSAMPTTTPKERRLRHLLIASGAVNLLVLGAVVGTALGMGWHRAPRSSSSSSTEDYGLWTFAKDLPADRRKEVRKTIRKERDVLQPLYIDIENRRRDAARLLTVEPFDREAFQQALDRLADSENKLKHTALGVVLKTSDSLSTDERKALGVWWEKRKSRYASRIRDKSGKDADKDAPTADAGKSNP